MHIFQIYSFDWQLKTTTIAIIREKLGNKSENMPSLCQANRMVFITITPRTIINKSANWQSAECDKNFAIHNKC